MLAVLCVTADASGYDYTAFVSQMSGAREAKNALCTRFDKNATPNVAL